MSRIRWKAHALLDPALPTSSGDRRSDGFQGNNITLNRGNSETYTLRRLKRDRPNFAVGFGGYFQ